MTVTRVLRIFALWLSLLTLGAQPVWAQFGAGITVHGRSGGAAIDIPINKSDVLRSAQPFFEVAVGNPEIADVQVLGDNSLYIFGRQFGATSITLSDQGGAIITVLDVNVVHDVGRLKQMLHAVLPTERIAVRAAHDGIVLSGTLSSGAAVKQAMTIAERFAPEAVSNLMQVRGNQQIMLAVRFVEMRRDAVKRLGLNAAAALGGGALSVFGDITTTVLQPPIFARLGVDISSGTNGISAILDLLDEKGVVRTLAEPTLVAMSGDTADFLAGGEFPIPIQTSDGQVTLEFKKFGVGLAFTPTVVRGDLVNVRLFMEVSELDQQNGIELNGFTIPGLVVRRANTTVELRNAQSFAIAGLLSENFSDNVNQVPFLGDVPIFGALARSTQFTSGQSELVMIVTPYMVRPVDGRQLRTPSFRAPSERDLFLNGTTERGITADANLNNSAGFSGPHGYSSW